MPTPNLARCSFCGKDHHSVRKFIAGPGVFICDACVTMCKEIIDKELTSEMPSHPSALTPDSCPVKFKLFPISHTKTETGLGEVAAFVAGLPKDNLIAITTLVDNSTVVWHRSSNL